ncbi:MAG: response regulator [Blastocatellia bacterium]
MKKPCVLVAEDNENQRELYSLLLELNGFEVKAVANGREALEELESYTPDLVLTDIAMPEMSGLELVEQVRRNQALSRLPIIVMTSFDRYYLHWAECVGADGTLRKPIDPEDLFTMILQLLPEHSGH